MKNSGCGICKYYKQEQHYMAECGFWSTDECQYRSNVSQSKDHMGYKDVKYKRPAKKLNSDCCCDNFIHLSEAEIKAKKERSEKIRKAVKKEKITDVIMFVLMGIVIACIMVISIGLSG